MHHRYHIFINCNSSLFSGCLCNFFVFAEQIHTQNSPNNQQKSIRYRMDQNLILIKFSNWE